MIDHTRPAEYTIDRIRFTHDGRSFTGRGLLTWDPDKGPHIQAFLDQSAPQENPFASLGVVQVETAADTKAIRLAGRGLGHAIVPNVFPLDLREHLHHGRLSIHPERVIFIHHVPSFASGGEDHKMWSGSAVFITKTEPEFPDRLNTETTLNGQLIASQNRGGLCFEEPEGFSVWGRKTAEGEFTISWALPRATTTKAQASHWAEAARRALSILFSQTVWIAKSSATRGVTEITELRRRKEARTLSHHLCPLTDFGPPDQWQFNRSAFIQLTRFFACEHPHAEICWSIFRRLAEASHHDTWGSRELLAGTTLEAALRTLDNHPFKPGDHTWKIKQSLASFRQNHLDAAWEKACDKALQARNRLRHRNAHPDWITSSGGAFSKPEWCQSIEDLTFLSRFYGYMILALAGFKPLQPRFPVVRFK